MYVISFCVWTHLSTHSPDASLSSETPREQVTSVKGIISSTEPSSLVNSEMVSPSTGQSEADDSITGRYNFHISVFACSFSLAHWYKVLVNDSPNRNYGLLSFEMPTTHPTITFASQMCVISSCVWLFCVDILRSYCYWQSLALHAHPAPVWPGSDRRPIHALLEYTKHHCTSWEQLHPETSEKQTDNIVTNFFFPPCPGQDPAAHCRKRRIWGRACGRHSRHEWLAGQFEEAEEIKGKLVVFVAPLAISSSSPFLFLFLSSSVLLSCHVLLQKTSCLVVLCSSRVAVSSIVP